jgi:hypothetical protein
MIYFLALIPATALTIAGYVALFLSVRSEGGLRTFGRYLGFWAFTLAGLVILGAIFAAAHGHRAHGFMHGMRGMHGLHGPPPPWINPGRGASPESAPAPPAPPAPPSPRPPATGESPSTPAQH